MSETNKSQSTPSFIIMLLLLLITVVGIQAWYMMDMKQTLDAMQSAQDSSMPPDMISSDATSASETETGAAALSNAQANIETDTEATVTASTDDADSAGDSVTQQAQTKNKEKNNPENSPENSPENNNIITPDSPANLAQRAPLPPPDARDHFFHRPYYSQNWDPHEELLRMQRHMQRAFNDRYSPADNRRSFSRHTDNSRPDFYYQFRQDFSVPEMDMRENQNEYIVLVNIPGADQKDMSINLEGQRLTVKGRQEYKKQESDPDGHFVFSERRSGRFQRSITLVEPVEKKGMKTQIDNGILRIIIPKKK